jgi:hypothetical protein
MGVASRLFSLIRWPSCRHTGSAGPRLRWQALEADAGSRRAGRAPPARRTVSCRSRFVRFALTVPASTGRAATTADTAGTRNRRFGRHFGLAAFGGQIWPLSDIRARRQSGRFARRQPHRLSPLPRRARPRRHGARRPGRRRTEAARRPGLGRGRRRNPRNDHSSHRLTPVTRSADGTSHALLVLAWI